MKFVIFGYGAIGKVHHKAIETIRNAELVAIIDSAVMWVDGITVFPDFESFTASHIAADVIIVSTPNGLHFQHAQMAILSGYNVLIEKPVVLSSKDFEVLLQLAEDKNLRVFNMLQLRFSPLVQWVKNVIDKGDLGALFLVNAACYWNRSEEYYHTKAWHGTSQWDGGVLFTQFSHFVDVLHFWLDQLQVVSHQSANYKHANCTDFDDSGVLTFRSGTTIGSIIYTTACHQQNFESHITLIGEKGTVKIAGQYMNELVFQSLANESARFSDTKPIDKFMHPAAIQEVMAALSSKRDSILDMKNSKNSIEFLEEVQIPVGNSPN